MIEKKVCPFTMYVCPSEDFNCALYDKTTKRCALALAQQGLMVQLGLITQEQLLSTGEKSGEEEPAEKNYDRSLTNNFLDDMIASK